MSILPPELAAATARFNAFAEALPLACLLVDAETSVPLAANNRALRLFADKIVGKPLLELTKNSEKVTAALKQFAASGSATPSRWALKTHAEGYSDLKITGALFGSDGSRKTVLLTLEPQSTDNPFHSLSKKLQDIQRERHQLQSDNLQLETRVSQRTEKLELRNEELDILNHSLNEFVSIVSHDLAGPARRIQSFATLLQSDLPKEAQTEEVSEYLRFLTESAERMTQMVKGSVRLSQIRPSISSWVEIDTEQVLHSLVEDLQALNPDIEFTVQHGDLHHLYADAGLAEQLLQNLLNNAIKFRNPGVSPLINISSTHNELLGYVEIAVADNGMGINDHDLQRVLRPFSRGAEAKGIPGTGLGLAMCNRICQQHQGRFWVERSSTGQDGTPSGTEFRFRLPSKAPD